MLQLCEHGLSDAPKGIFELKCACFEQQQQQQQQEREVVSLFNRIAEYRLTVNCIGRRVGVDASALSRLITLSWSDLISTSWFWSWSWKKGRERSIRYL